MKNYFQALSEVFRNSVFWIFLILDFIALLGGLLKVTSFEPKVYALVLMLGTVFSSIHLVVKKNIRIRNLDNVPKAKLRFTIENRDQNNKPIVIQKREPARYESDTLYLIIRNDGDGIAKNLTVRIKRPSNIQKHLWKADGNSPDSEHWMTVRNEEIYKSGENEVIHPGDNLPIGMWVIRNLYGEECVVEYRAQAENADMIEGKLKIIKKMVE